MGERSEPAPGGRNSAVVGRSGRRRWSTRWWPCAGIALAVLARDAAADDRAQAQALFDAAKALATEGKHAEACPKFEASYRLDRTLGTLLNLADCHEKIGKTASAWAEFEEAAEKARNAGDPRVDFANQRRDALAPRLSKLTISVQNPVAGLSVHRDETKVEEAGFGVPLPIDPGKHVVRVKRGDQVLKELPVDVADASTATVALDLAAIDKAAPPPAATAPAVTSTAPATAEPPSSTGRTVGLIVGGVGVAAVGVAGVLEIIALTGKPGKDQCVGKVCAPQGFDDAESAKKTAEIGQWVGIGGLVAVAVGVTLFLTAPSPAPTTTGRQTPAAWASPWLAPAAGGVAAGGRF